MAGHESLTTTSSGVHVSAQFGWRSIGHVLLDDDGELLFPAVEDRPGLYRFDLARAGVSHAYVGESDRLRRRFCHYRRPGPSQRTNVRLNALLKGVLVEGASVGVAVVLDRASIRVGGLTKPCDLTSKFERVLLEHAALIVLREDGVVALNA